MKHDFKTQWAMNWSTSRSHQETWWARDKSNNNKHSKRDYHWTMRESIESQKETAFSWSVLISTVYWVLIYYESFILTRYQVACFYRESYSMRDVY